MYRELFLEFDDLATILMSKKWLNSYLSLLLCKRFRVFVSKQEHNIKDENSHQNIVEKDKHNATWE